MFKKMFALASVTALTGLVATISAVGCSSTTTIADNTEAGPGGGPEGGVKKPDSGGPIPDVDSGGDTDGGGTPASKTVGNDCTSSADCKVAGTKNDNVCSKGFFNAGDLLGSPVCVGPSCTQGTGGNISDLICDDGAGFCLATQSGGICLPFCSYDSTKVVDACKGGNKCAIDTLGIDSMTKTASAIGFCFGACAADADCKGTAGEKCQVEDGLCVKTLATYKALGTACNGAAAVQECNCSRVGNFADGGKGPDADKGFCQQSCVTGAAGDTFCGGKAAGYKCTTKLPLDDGKGQVFFTGQAPDVSGVCALPCTTDAQCMPLITSSGLTGLIKCKAFAGGSFCDATAQ